MFIKLNIIIPQNKVQLNMIYNLIKPKENENKITIVRKIINMYKKLNQFNTLDKHYYHFLWLPVLLFYLNKEKEITQNK